MSDRLSIMPIPMGILTLITFCLILANCYLTISVLRRGWPILSAWWRASPDAAQWIALAGGCLLASELAGWLEHLMVERGVTKEVAETVGRLCHHAPLLAILLAARRKLVTSAT
jgi:hypothetical protein